MAEKTPASSEVLDEHYRNLADDYDEFLHYSDDFVRTLTAKMIDHLDLGEEDRLADIGCGTGIYSVDILEQVDLKQPILGVDPYPEMLAAIPDEANIEPTFASSTTSITSPPTKTPELFASTGSTCVLGRFGH